MPGRGPGLSSWSAYTSLQRVAPSELVDQIVPRAAVPGADRGGVPARRRAPHRQLHPPGRGRRPPPDRRGEGPRPRRDVAITRASTGSTSFCPQSRSGRHAPRDLSAGSPAGDPADPGAPRPASRSARLPPYGPCLDLDRRGAPGHPPQAEAPPPHRARRALRRERVGGQLRAVHAAPRLRAARAVPEGARVHLHRPRPRGHPPLPAGRRPGRRDGRPRRHHRPRRLVGAHQLRAGTDEVRRDLPRRAGAEVVTADPRRRPLQLRRPAARRPEADGRLRAARVVAQSRAPTALGHRRLGGDPRYGEVVPMVECHNLTQLGEFVHDLAG